MSVLLEMLSDIEHRQWAEWADAYIQASERKRVFMTTMVAYDYRDISCDQKAIYIPWAKQAVHAFMAAGYPITDTSVIMSCLMRLDHEQRGAWLAYQAANMTDENIARWDRQIRTHYDNLSEKEKESDREWARKVIEAVDAKLAKTR